MNRNPSAKVNYLIVVFMLLCGMFGYGQKFSGRVYGQDVPVEGALVQNKTQKISVNTDAYGDFLIAASIGDSLVFKAPFYSEQILRIGQKQLSETWVIELKSDLNQLDEVTVTKRPEEKKFDVKEYNAQLNADIKEDMKNNPGRYSSAPSGGMDFIKIAGLIANLFKRKRSNKEKATQMTYEQLKELFKTDDLINDQLLTERFNIPDKYHGLFIDFCIEKGMDSRLLATDSSFLILDAVVNYNEEFQKVLDDYKASNGSLQVYGKD